MNHIVENDEIDLRELFLVVWNRRIFIVLFVLLISAMALAAALLKPPVYSSRAKLLVLSTEPIGIHNDMLNDHQAISRLEQRTGGQISDVELRIESVAGSSMLDLIVTSNDPDKSSSIADAWAETYLMLTAERKVRDRKALLSDMEGNVAGLEKELEGHSEFITLKRAISDESVLMSLEASEDIWKSLNNKVLVSQEINPIYSEISKNISDMKIQIRNVKSEIRSLESTLARLNESGGANQGVRAGDIQLFLYSGLPKQQSSSALKNLLLALSLSLFAGVILSFVSEFISSAVKTKE